jgi:hypothetical protein
MLRGCGQAVWWSGNTEAGWEGIEKEDGKWVTEGEVIIIICLELVRSLAPWNRQQQYSSVAIPNILIPVSSADQATLCLCWLQNPPDSVSLVFHLLRHSVGLLLMLSSPTCLHPFMTFPPLPTCSNIFNYITESKFHTYLRTEIPRQLPFCQSQIESAVFLCIQCSKSLYVASCIHGFHSCAHGNCRCFPCQKIINICWVQGCSDTWNNFSSFQIIFSCFMLNMSIIFLGTHSLVYCLIYVLTVLRISVWWILTMTAVIKPWYFHTLLG